MINYTQLLKAPATPINPQKPYDGGSSGNFNEAWGNLPYGNGSSGNTNAEVIHAYETGDPSGLHPTAANYAAPLSADGGGGGAPVAVPNQGGNPVANSVSPPAFGSHPQLTPELMAQFSKLLGENTYSVEAGGYIPSNQAENANSYWNKFGAGSGGDPAANKAMGDFYATLGDQPTVANTSPALAQFNASTGASPTLGPSLNSTLGSLISGPNGPTIEKTFGPKYEGPFKIPGY